MKNYKTVLFMVAVLAGLAFICIVFPKDGIQIGHVKLEFPDLREVMAVDDDKEQSADDVMAQRKLQLAKAEKAKAIAGEFQKLCKDMPSQIYMPHGDLTYLDPFFASLDNARKKHVRIMHYADSQIEQDLMTSTLREHFQTQFGGGGVGMLTPVDNADMYTVVRSQSPALTGYHVYSQDDRGNGDKYGPMGTSAHLSGGSVHYKLSLSSTKRYPHTGLFSKVSVLMSGSGSMTAKVGGKSYKLSVEKESAGMKLYSASIPVTGKCELTVSGSGNLYSIMLDNPNGVSMDNIPMRGCSGTIFEKIDQSSYAPYFKLQDVALIILQYGGNIMEEPLSDGSIHVYTERMKEQINIIRKAAPQARILYIGPADMATTIRGSRKTYPALPRLCKALKKMADEAGIAYWDMFDTMGGRGTIVQWAKEGLATKDYVHFNPSGAEKMSNMFYDTFKLYYDNYSARTGKTAAKNGANKKAGK